LNRPTSCEHGDQARSLFSFFIKTKKDLPSPGVCPAPPPISDQADRPKNLKPLLIKACRKRHTLTVFLTFRFLLKTKPKKTQTDRPAEPTS